jgi:hypothetical protein
MKQWSILDPSALLSTGFRFPIKRSKSTKACYLALVAAIFVLCSSAHAQQPTMVPRVGYVTSTGNSNDSGPSGQAFRQGLRDLGYVQGKNIRVEYRFI